MTESIHDRIGAAHQSGIREGDVIKRRGLAILIVISLLAAAGIWWWSTRAPRWNVVLITLDTTRADHLGCYGDESASTPNLDQLASRSTLFERAYTVVPITLPAHATLLTGLLPPEHGLRINGTNRLENSVPTLAEILREQEYRTGAFVSSLVLDSQFGLAQGFEVFNDRLGGSPAGPHPERPAAETVSSAIEWLESLASEPFFCWVHLYDPHEPYEPHPEEFGDEFEGRLYEGEIAYMDRHVGRLLDSLSHLEIDDQTLIVVAGDHGEGLGEHNEETHGYLAYNSTMHVPLLIRSPDQEQPGFRVEAPVSLVDIFPTVLDCLQLESPTKSFGRSLLPYWTDEASANRSCYGETEAPLMEGGWCPLRTWTTDRWKYIQSTQPELYDLQNDPDETENLVDQSPDEADRLRQELADFEAKLIVRQGGTAALSEQEQRALASLGYTGGHFVEQPVGVERRDIKETLKYAEQVHRCMHLIDENELEQAQQILEGVVEALPDYAKAWGTLGVCFAKQNEYAAAEQHFRKTLELDDHQNFARIGLGRALYAQDELKEAAEQLQSAVRLEPSALDAQYFLGESYRKLQQWDQARTAFEAVLIIAPEFSAAKIGLADTARDQGRLEEAAARYKRILQEDPSATAAVLGFAQVLKKVGHHAEAADMFEIVLQRTPNEVPALVGLSRLLATTPIKTLKDSEKSVKLAQRATELTERREIEPLRSLAQAYAANGQVELAITSAEAALELAQAENSDDVIAEIERELRELKASREER